jgi:hypothetical protein
MAKSAKKVPKTSSEAKKKGYTKTTVKHAASERKKWVWLKQKGKWQFAKAASATASAPHTVCFYDPKTGQWDDCHVV